MATAVEKTKPSQSPPPPPTSFSSLPHDVVLNCLARVSRSYSPILSLVSKSFRTLMSSPELHATRALIGKTEYVCLDLDNNNSKPHWFTLSQIPKQQKLIPISLTHHKRSISVVDSPEEQENQKRVDPRLWNSSVSYSPNCEYLEELQKSTGIKDCGEVYNPKIQMWEPLSPTVDLDGLKKCVPLNICTVEGDNNCTVEGDNNVRYEISVEKGKLVWRNIVEGWSLVRGLERLSSKSYFPDNLVSVASLGRGGRVAVWWKTVEVGRQGRPYTLQFKTNIWCVEISFEMRPCLHPSGLQFDDELWGFVECDGILDISVYELEHLLRGEMHTVIKDVVTMSPNVINGPVTEQLPEC
uniref:F-box domain-containing protein n=2 Tax=Brassica oleracea TaxID=3712 RepID=A0A0D3DR90_BRAOL|nr:unnamed protein product [Brassica oleracea]